MTPTPPAAGSSPARGVGPPQEHERKYRSLFESSLDAVYLTRPDGTVLDANAAACRMHRMTVDEIRRRGRAGLIVADERLAAALREREATGRTTAELDFIRGDGTTFPVEVESVIVEASRSDWTAFVIARDISDRKRAEEELAVVARLYAVLSRVNEAIVRTRDDRALYEQVCRILADEGAFPLVWIGLVNGRRVAPAACWGRATPYLREIAVELEGELDGGPTATAIREDRPVVDDVDGPPATAPWRHASARHGLRASAAFPLHRGVEVIGALTLHAASPAAFGATRVQLLEALCGDVSHALGAIQAERRRADAEHALRDSEQSLREADRRKDEFLSVLSHELRNPLAPIRSSIYVLRHAAPGSDQAARAQAIIERQTEHLARLVDDLLDVTRIARGKIALRRTPVDLREVVLRAADDFRVVMEDRGLAFRIAVPATRAWADADASRITQVLGNLLHNAAKFTPRGGEVTLSLETNGPQAEIAVRDTGPGIDPALRSAVFDAFVQDERTLARSEGGLGLGLALVKGITELHGGSVRVESPGLDRGTTFVVALPLVAGLAARGPAGDDAPRTSTCRRVLIVDDNRDLAESLADALTMLGHAAEVAHDGPSAIEKARANAPDVVLCDIGLPGMTGYDVAPALRAVANVPLLFAMSGYAQPDDVKRAKEAGFDGHIAKPFDMSTIERLLA